MLAHLLIPILFAGAVPTHLDSLLAVTATSTTVSTSTETDELLERLRVLGQSAKEPPGRTAPLPSRVPETAAHSTWYGWQLLFGDLLLPLVLIPTISAIPASQDAPIAVLSTLGAVTWFLHAPILHAANGHADSIPLSVALRVLLPAGTMAMGALLGSGSDGADLAVGFGALFGIPVGAVAASLIDLALLSTVERSPTTAAVQPFVSMDEDSRVFGAAGRF